MFTEDSNDGERYRGDMKSGKIINAAVKKMQNFVSSIDKDNYEEWYERERETKHKIIYFTDKKETPATFKALSKKYLYRVDFGEVKESEEELIEQFGIYTIPVIMALTDPENFKGEKYDGEVSRE